MKEGKFDDGGKEDVAIKLKKKNKWATIGPRCALLPVLKKMSYIAKEWYHVARKAV